MGTRVISPGNAGRTTCVQIALAKVMELFPTNGSRYSMIYAKLFKKSAGNIQVWFGIPDLLIQSHSLVGSVPTCHLPYPLWKPFPLCAFYRQRSQAML